MYNNIKVKNLIYYMLCIYAITSCIHQGISYLCLGISVFLSCVFGIRNRSNNYMWKVPVRYKRAILIFLGVFFFFALISGEVHRSISQYWWIFTSIAPVFIVSIFVRKKSKMRVLFALLLISFFVNICYAVGMNLQVWLQNFSGRAYGFDSIINFAGRLLIFIPILVVLLMNIKNYKIKIVLGIALLISFLAVLMNGTRVVWLIIPVIVAFILCIYLKEWKKIFAVFAVCSICLSALLYAVAPIRNTILSVTNIEHSSTKGHYYIGRDAFLLFKENPIIGIGLGRFKTLYNEKYKSAEVKAVEGNKTVFHAHNNTLTILAETGIIGGLIFWYMFGTFLLYSFKDWYINRSQVALMFFTVSVALALQGITDYSFGLRPVMMQYFTLLGLYLSYQYQQENGFK